MRATAFCYSYEKKKEGYPLFSILSEESKLALVTWLMGKESQIKTNSALKDELQQYASSHSPALDPLTVSPPPQSSLLREFKKQFRRGTKDGFRGSLEAHLSPCLGPVRFGLSFRRLFLLRFSSARAWRQLRFSIFKNFPLHILRVLRGPAFFQGLGFVSRGRVYKKFDPNFFKRKRDKDFKKAHSVSRSSSGKRIFRLKKFFSQIPSTVTAALRFVFFVSTHYPNICFFPNFLSGFEGSPSGHPAYYKDYFDRPKRMLAVQNGLGPSLFARLYPQDSYFSQESNWGVEDFVTRLSSFGLGFRFFSSISIYFIIWSFLLLSSFFDSRRRLLFSPLVKLHTDPRVPFVPSVVMSRFTVTEQRMDCEDYAETLFSRLEKHISDLSSKSKLPMKLPYGASDLWLNARGWKDKRGIHSPWEMKRMVERSLHIYGYTDRASFPENYERLSKILSKVFTKEALSYRYIHKEDFNRSKTRGFSPRFKGPYKGGSNSSNKPFYPNQKDFGDSKKRWAQGGKPPFEKKIGTDRKNFRPYKAAQTGKNASTAI